MKTDKNLTPIEDLIAEDFGAIGTPEREQFDMECDAFIIGEQPSVAKDIADVLGAKTKHDGYIEGNGYQVTWTFGHLCTLKEPHDYTQNWKNWSLGSLPINGPPRPVHGRAQADGHHPCS